MNLSPSDVAAYSALAVVASNALLAVDRFVHRVSGQDASLRRELEAERRQHREEQESDEQLRLERAKLVDAELTRMNGVLNEIRRKASEDGGAWQRVLGQVLERISAHERASGERLARVETALGLTFQSPERRRPPRDDQEEKG